ncbi:MAG TPA: HlyD family efflux transporter periplasmic adaptor subunit [Dinghuibacter sp.]|jgi:HlyD family secretion protein|uniref:efflux RND transporter periplasmic adaptor subunit n=1 Tax=Dinghuibacter sp. TaxID=2024697 RepID=UPI002C92A225|nr:HlyD family efflux transporter periplasmic adaptor subunit [Dinghuibacter sp.]HTJ13111.1 HlyD family efflux transporter periplasmic adaptor subunit [Dinghuibacter sp.]
MDTPIQETELAKKRRKRWIVAAAALAILALALWATWILLTPSLTRADITTAVATTGNIENTITASGEVLPEFEETLTSSIDCSIRKVLKDEGATVEAGESILTLDKSQTEADLEKMRFQLASKQGDIERMKVDLGESYSDIQSNNAIKQLHIGNLSDEVENAKKLFEAGGGTREQIEQAELNLKVAQEEKKQLENQILAKQQTMKLDIKSSELAADIQASDLHALERKLELANATATRAGVITYVDKNIGSSVRQGETLARIADLSSFKVSGSISDNYLDQLKAGMPAIVRVNDTLLRGRVDHVYPSVQGGLVGFDVVLDRANEAKLRPHLKVDVYLVTAAHTGIVRVSNGAAFKGGKSQDVFVVDNGRAYRRSVTIGLSNFDYVEIVQGIHPGDTVITSDMSGYKTIQQLNIKNP